MSKQLTVNEIKALLDAKRIKYNSKSKKADLMQLLDYEAPATPKKEYIVVYDFKDLEDGGHVYWRNDSYPHEDAKEPTPERIRALTTANNKLNKVLIRERS